jgi:hypothetical protein
MHSARCFAAWLRLKGVVAVFAALGLAATLAACGRSESDSGTSSRAAAELGCDAADARRPDKPRENVAGTSAPAVPRRTCTLPQTGCVTPQGTERAAPPTPGVRVVRVTRAAIEIAYDVGTDLRACRPDALSVAVYVTASGLSPDVHRHSLSGSRGSVRIKPSRPPGTPKEYGPADVLMVASNTDEGMRSEHARVRIPPPKGEQGLSAAEERRVKARRQACRPDINDRTNCNVDARSPVSGPVTQGSAADLTRSVRESLETHGGFSILRLKCFKGSRCDAAFAFGTRRRRLEMSYRIEAVKSAPACWELTGFRVTRPVPEYGNFAAPLPSQGCVEP